MRLQGIKYANELNFGLRVLDRGREASMYKQSRLGRLTAVIGAAVIMTVNLAHAQVDGAVQYPPASVGKDAQPPPPAGMVPQSIAPRRIELGISGSSQPPAAYPSRLLPSIDNDRFLTRPGLSRQPSSSAVQN